MDAFLRKVRGVVVPIGVEGAGRRPNLRRALQCDVLEDRQLLSWGGAGGALGHFRGAGGHYGMFSSGGLQGLHGRRIDPGLMWQGANSLSSTPSSSSSTPTSNPTPDSTATTTTSSDTTSSSATSTPSSATTTPADSSSTTTSSSTTPVSTSSTTTTIPATTATTGSSSTSTSGWSTTTPVNSNPALQADFQKLQTDRNAILAKSQVTVGQLATLQGDLQQIHKDATSAPLTSALQAFQDDLKSIQGSLPTAAQTTQLEKDFTALVQSEGVTDQSLITKTISDAEAIVNASNLTSQDLSTLSADQKAIQTDLSSTTNGPNGGPGVGMDGLTSLGGLLGGAMGGPMGLGGGFRGLPNGPMTGAPAGHGFRDFWGNGPTSPSSTSTNSSSGSTSTQASNTTPGTPGGPLSGSPGDSLRWNGWRNGPMIR